MDIFLPKVFVSEWFINITEYSSKKKKKRGWSRGDQKSNSVEKAAFFVSFAITDTLQQSLCVSDSTDIGQVCVRAWSCTLLYMHISCLCVRVCVCVRVRVQARILMQALWRKYLLRTHCLCDRHDVSNPFAIKGFKSTRTPYEKKWNFSFVRNMNA